MPGPTASKTGWRVRPAPHWADYRTPLKGLYQCGSSAHRAGASAAAAAITPRARYCAIAGADDVCFSSMP